MPVGWLSRESLGLPAEPFALDPESRLARGLVGWFHCTPYGAVDLVRASRRNPVDNSSGDITRGVVAELGRVPVFSGDGTNDRIQIAGGSSIATSDPLSLAGLNTFTVAFALTYNGSPNSSFPRVFDRSNGGNALNGYAVWLATGSPDKLAFRTGTTTSTTSATQWDSDGDPFAAHGVPYWCAFVGTDIDSVAGGQWYLNGLPIATTALARNAATVPSVATAMSIGNWNHTTDRMWDGAIAYVGIWNRALSPDEVWSLYEPATRWDVYWRPRRFYMLPAAAGGGFQSAWAARSTVTIQPGMVA